MQMDHVQGREKTRHHERMIGYKVKKYNISKEEVKYIEDNPISNK